MALSALRYPITSKPSRRLLIVVSRISPGKNQGNDTPVTGDAAEFAAALSALRDVTLRPELVIEEVPAPTRLAPHAVAIAGEVIPHHHDEDDDAIATGRFVVLFDPSSPEPWEGQYRLVTYAKALMEPEVGSDPLAGEVGWAWLTEALQERGLSWAAEAGTVTAVSSQSFGALAEREPTVELEIRASWSPVLERSEDLAGHLQAWADLMCTLGGLPPLPEGVVPLPGIRR